MIKRAARWTRAQFAASQTRRDQDLDAWWQLPSDPTRVPSRWLQPFADWVAPTTFSEWHRRVAEHRVMAYDGLRPPLTRLMCVVVMGVAFALLGVPWWVWALMAPAVVQIPLETYLQKFHADTSPEPRWELARDMRDVARQHFDKMTVNVTGLIGAVACPLLLVAACFAPPGGGWGGRRWRRWPRPSCT